ncbi:MAG TPA: YceI family protein [Candidatus Nitrosotalea sp.]|nr:YceI family protein [Candidatus Nitrosotalea sp.]
MREKFVIDQAHTVIGFSARHLGISSVRGHFGKVEGWFEADREDLITATGEVEIDVTSITTNQEQRDGHLKSADFFEADKYPTLRFHLTGVERQNVEDYLILGDLTIKDVTKSITLNARFEGEVDSPFTPGAKVVGVTADGEINRMDYGLNWNGLAGVVPLASHNIKIHVEAELVASPVESAVS